MKNNQAKRLRELEERAMPVERRAYVWVRHDQTYEEAKEAAGLAPDAPCEFFKWQAPQ